MKHAVAFLQHSLKRNFQMLIGFFSNLIVFPPIILIVYLFKKSKPLKKRKNRLDLGLELGWYHLTK